MSRSYRYGGIPTPSGYHYGKGGLGVLGSEVPSDGVDGPSPIYNGLSLPSENNNEFRIVLITTPTLGTLFIYEDTSFSFTGPDGVHTWTYGAYKDGILYGTGTVTLVIGEGLGGTFALDDFLLEGSLSGPLAPPNLTGRRIGPRIGLRANGELLVLF
jgi:hypothetical protein